MERVLHHFYELTKIPRPSGKEERVVEYIENFAKKSNLEYFKDNYNNIIVKKFSCNKQPIIVQAHTETILVLKRKNAWLLISFLGYGLYYLYFLIYVLFTLISALIIINTEANNSFIVSADLIVQVIIPLLMNLVYSLFISLIVYRYYKPFNYQMISVCGYVLITAIIGNILYNVVNSHNFQLISIVNITFSMQALVPIIVGSILTIVLLMFWIIFPLRLTNELSNQE